MDESILVVVGDSDFCYGVSGVDSSSRLLRAAEAKNEHRAPQPRSDPFRAAPGASAVGPPTSALWIRAAETMTALTSADRRDSRAVTYTRRTRAIYLRKARCSSARFAGSTVG